MSNQLGVKGSGSQFATDDNTPPSGSVGTSQLANDGTTNAKLAEMAAYTTKANITGASANPTDASRSEMSLMYDASVRASAIAVGSGLIAENQDRRQVNGGTTLTSGRVYFNSIGLIAGETITDICMGISSAAAPGNTMSRLGLYSKAGVLLAQTANLGAAWDTQGMKFAALTSPYLVLTTDLYYIALIQVNAGAPPAPFRLVGSTVQIPLMTGLPFITGEMSAQTDLPANATIVANANIVTMWFGVR